MICEKGPKLTRSFLSCLDASTELSQEDLEWVTKLSDGDLTYVLSAKGNVELKNQILTSPENLNIVATSIVISDSIINGFDAATGTAKNITFSAETIKLTNSVGVIGILLVGPDL